MPGRLEVITGGMFSGKSEELIRRLRRAQIAELRVLAVKPAADDRYQPDQLASHVGGLFPSEVLEGVQQLEPLVRERQPQVLGIEEAQLFGPGLTEVVQRLGQGDLRILVCGLDLDYRGQPFAPLPELMALADEVLKLHAVCVRCGADATRSQLLVADPGGTEPLLVGAAESYQARCGRCWEPPT